MADEGFGFTLSGEFGGAYRVDVATNPLNWTPLTTLTSTWGKAQFTDPATTNFPLKLYRAVQLP